MVDTKAMTDEINKMFKNMPGLENINATIQAVSPTTVLNFLDKDNQENPHHIIGAALLINGFGERKEIIFESKKFDVPAIADIKNKCSILYIKDYQKLEALNIIDGALTLLVTNNVIDNTIAYDIINDIVDLNNFVRINKVPYIQISSEDSLLTVAKANESYAKVINNFIDIIRYLWFVPYGKLDEIYNDFVSEYNDSQNKKS